MVYAVRKDTAANIASSRREVHAQVHLIDGEVLTKQWEKAGIGYFRGAVHLDGSRYNHNAIARGAGISINLRPYNVLRHTP